MKVVIEIDETPRMHKLREMEESIDEVDDSKEFEWARILYELEETGQSSIEEIGSRAFESYVLGGMDSFEAEKWINMLTELSEFAKTEMEE